MPIALVPYRPSASPTVRLINCQTMELEEFIGNIVPTYAILSHTWGHQEVSFAQYSPVLALSMKIPGGSTSEEGYKKVTLACKQALRDGYRYAWVDTCCIDKRSSSELSENINSMYKYYQKSNICYVYLSDVDIESLYTTFGTSRWFRRGWTLQELLAPSRVIFFDRDWIRLFEKLECSHWISEITGIDESALRDINYSRGGLGVYCVARRMSWASNRETTRTEDMAYCLLGIFNVSMPLLYGEGSMAFTRLQEEIIKRSDDESILAWGLDTRVEDEPGMSRKALISLTNIARPSSILARSPMDFKHSRHLQYGTKPRTPILLTNLGLQIELNLVPVHPSKGYAKNKDPKELLGWIAVVNCRTENDTELVGIMLSQIHESDHAQRIEVGYQALGVSARCPPNNTMLVNERVAIQGTATKITVVGASYSESVRQFASEVHKFNVMMSSACQAIGYFVSTASHLDNRTTIRHSDENLEWNEKSQILTASNPTCDVPANFCRFVFESPKGYSSFMVITRGMNAIVRHVSPISIDQNEQFFDFLEANSQPEDTEDVFLKSARGTEFRIKVLIKVKTVCHWKVYEIHVDVVNLHTDVA